MAVYFAQLPTGAIKIGHSDDVPTRLKQLEAHYGVPLVLLHTEPGSRPEEEGWHERFDHLRLGRSEQFMPAADLMAAIGRPLMVAANPGTTEATKGRTTLVRMDDELVEKARKVAALRRIGLGEYLASLLRPLVKRDLEREARKLTGGPKGEE